MNRHDESDLIGATDMNVPLDQVLKNAEKILSAQRGEQKNPALDRMFNHAFKSFDTAMKNSGMEDKII